MTRGPKPTLAVLRQGRMATLAWVTITAAFGAVAFLWQQSASSAAASPVAPAIGQAWPLLSLLVLPFGVAVWAARAGETGEARYQHLYRHAPVMLQALGSDGSIREVSDLWLSRTGYTLAEVRGRGFADFVAREDRARAVELLRALEAEAGCPRSTLRLRTRSGALLETVAVASRADDAPGDCPLLLALEDVSEARRRFDSLAQEFEGTLAALQALSDAVVTTDRTGRVTHLNPAAESLTGWTRGSAMGEPVDEVLQLLDPRRRHQTLSPAADALEGVSAEGAGRQALLLTRSGEEVSVEVMASAMRGADQRILGAVVVFRDLGRASKAMGRLSRMAQHDSLTDLPNRLLLEDRLGQAIHAAQRQRSRVALMFLDLDRFKEVNDSLGHAAGDELLREMARRLTALLRDTDTVSRLGGDEFVILLGNLDSRDQAAEVGGKLLEAAVAPCHIGERTVSVSVSLGVAVYPDDGEDGDTLMRLADAAMYRAKRDGRNRMCFHQPAAALPINA